MTRLFMFYVYQKAPAVKELEKSPDLLQNVDDILRKVRLFFTKSK